MKPQDCVNQKYGIGSSVVVMVKLGDCINENDIKNIANGAIEVGDVCFNRKTS